MIPLFLLAIHILVALSCYLTSNIHLLKPSSPCIPARKLRIVMFRPEIQTILMNFFSCLRNFLPVITIMHQFEVLHYQTRVLSTPCAMTLKFDLRTQSFAHWNLHRQIIILCRVTKLVSNKILRLLNFLILQIYSLHPVRGIVRVKSMEVNAI